MASKHASSCCYRYSPSYPRLGVADTSKLSKVESCRYIEPGFVKSLTGYFPVPKTKCDIRMVYDATKCGLDDLVGAPDFFIHSVDSMVDLLDANSWMGDIELGEMFLNFPLDPKVRESTYPPILLYVL
jgi:hypothetical protein